MANPSEYQLIQTVNPATSSSTPVTVNVTNTKAGSLLVIGAFGSDTSHTLSSITDNGGNTWQKATSDNSNTAIATDLWYAKNTNPTTTLTVNYASFAGSVIGVFFREYGGMFKSTTVLDRTAASVSGSSASLTTGVTSARRNANELLVCVGFGSGASNTLSVGTNFGNFTSQSMGAATGVLGIEDQTVSTIGGTDAGTMNNSSPSTFSILIATFAIASGDFYKRSNALRPHAFSPGLAR